MSESMFRLIESDPSAPRQSQLRHASPSRLIEWALERDPFSFQFLGGCLDVVAEQVKLVMALLLGRMEGELRGRKGEDEPAAARIDGVETQDRLEKRAVGLGVPAVDDYVRARDQRLHSLSLSRVMTWPVLAWTNVRPAGRRTQPGSQAVRLRRSRARDQLRHQPGGAGGGAGAQWRRQDHLHLGVARPAQTHRRRG